ncbi:glycosyltransferase [Fortiea contorta]|uniref:glycosyltransferase n=1 Tax=Fortiea contorta TaxID=1892405 RepID=UPI00034554C2|nr:glycosyltransferase [Fortiea contorta]
MKIIQVPFCFYPDPVGGTEIYVEALSHNLQQQGIEILIAAPGEVSQSYMHNQLKVRRFAVANKIKHLQEIYATGDPQAAFEFSLMIETEQPDIVHVHAFTSSISLRLVQTLKQRRIPVVFTYHTPTVSCLRGTLMQWGTQICDGKLDLHTCTQCTLQGLGLDQTSAKAITHLPSQLGAWLGGWNLQGGVWTALRMKKLVSLCHEALHAMFSEANHIVAVCNWVKDILLLNHVPSDKISVIRQGVCHNLPEKFNFCSHNNTSTLKIAFLGRLDPTKGIHILITALQTIPELPISLDIYGVSQSTNSNTYQQELQTLAINNSRITFKPPVPSEQVITTLKGYDLLAVPSQLLETGPMVVLEAFAAGIPILGSNLGGISELIQSEVNGLLVEPNSVTAWSQALQRLCLNKALIPQLKSGIQPPQKIETVADQMLSIYHAVLQN